MKTKLSVYQLVRDQANPYSILQAANIDFTDAYKYVFESYSFVVGMKDMKTCYEMCFCPEGIETWQEPTNPVFQIGHRLV